MHTGTQERQITQGEEDGGNVNIYAVLPAQQ